MLDLLNSTPVARLLAGDLGIQQDREQDQGPRPAGGPKVALREA